MIALIFLLFELVLGTEVKLATNTCMSVDMRGGKKNTNPEMYGKLTFPTSGNLRGIKLIYRSGAINCYAAGQYSHWGCDLPPLPKLDVVAMFITDGSMNVKYPTPETTRWRGWTTTFSIPSKRTWYKWAKPNNQGGPNRNLPELDFDGPNYSVSAGQSWRVYYGETLFWIAMTDNRGRVCFDVVGDMGPRKPEPSLGPQLMVAGTDPLCLKAGLMVQQPRTIANFAQFSFQETGEVVSITLDYVSGGVNCHGTSGRYHWGCDINPQNYNNDVGIFVVNEQQRVLYPTEKTTNWRGWDNTWAPISKNQWYHWGKPNGRNAPSLWLDGGRYHVKPGTVWRIYYGEALYKAVAGDNKGHVCFTVKVEFAQKPTFPTPPANLIQVTPKDRPICLSGIDLNGYAKFRFPKDQVIQGLTLTYRTGAWTCQYDADATNNFWGCKYGVLSPEHRNMLGVIVTDSSNHPVYPTASTKNMLGFKLTYSVDYWYKWNVPHATGMKHLTFDGPSYTVRKGQEWRIFFSEPLKGIIHRDNAGKICVDVSIRPGRPAHPCRSNSCGVNTRCTPSSSAPWYTCTKVDPCSPNPCGVNGKCASSNVAPGYTCTKVDPCKSNSNPCGINEKCASSNVAPGYTCTKVDPCKSQSNPCGVNGKCTISTTAPGYTCTKVDPCKSKSNPCGVNGKCTISTTAPGYTCTKVDPCKSKSNPCGVNGKCTISTTAPGYTCTKVDPCKSKSNPCGVNGKCAISTTAPGYTCTKVDPCKSQSNPCGVNGKCAISTTAPGYTCTKVDPCKAKQSPCGPNEKCTISTTAPGYTCKKMDACTMKNPCVNRQNCRAEPTFQCNIGNLEELRTGSCEGSFQISNFGVFNSAAECGNFIAKNPQKCNGGIFMYAPLSKGWGCRCCVPNPTGWSPAHKYWKLFQKCLPKAVTCKPKYLNLCKSRPCGPNERCAPSNAAPGYTCTKVDPCKSKPCGLNEQCAPSNVAPGYTCKKIDPCQPNPCPAKTKCEANANGGHKCKPVSPCGAENPCINSQSCQIEPTFQCNIGDLKELGAGSCEGSFQGANFGAFKSAAECGNFVAKNPNKCRGGTFMFAPSAKGWGCRCCVPNPTKWTKSHQYWRLFQKCIPKAVTCNKQKNQNKCESKPCKANEACEVISAAPGFQCKKKNEPMAFKGKGCCRFENAIAKDWDLEKIDTEAGCLAQCQKDITCVAADIEFVDGVAVCATFKGDVKLAFQLQDCGHKDAHKCFIKSSRIKELGIILMDEMTTWDTVSQNALAIGTCAISVMALLGVVLKMRAHNYHTEQMYEKISAEEDI